MNGGEYNNYNSSPESPMGGSRFTKSAASVTSAGGGNMKVRLATLEDSFEAQYQKNEDTDSKLEKLFKDSQVTNERLMKLMQENKDRFDENISALRKEFGHKFELQMAENQRTQHHISTLKAEKVALQKKLGNTIERLRAVEQEVCGYDGGADNFDDGATFAGSGAGSPVGTAASGTRRY
jgi:hypothetical protein